MDIPTTGTDALLKLLSPYVPDLEVEAALPRRTGGRRAEWSSSQLLRVLLLLLLTPARSTNLLCELLPEQRGWRRFAHLPNLRRLPNARQLHEFRDRLTPGVLRAFNACVLQCLFATWPAGQPGVALIDATDLPAATNEYKKSATRDFPRVRRRWARAPSRPDGLAILSATRNIPCGFGWPIMGQRSCWSR